VRDSDGQNELTNRFNRVYTVYYLVPTLHDSIQVGLLNS